MNPPDHDKSEPAESQVDFIEYADREYKHSWAEKDDEAAIREKPIPAYEWYPAEPEPGEHDVERALTTVTSKIDAGERILILGFMKPGSSPSLAFLAGFASFAFVLVCILLVILIAAFTTFSPLWLILLALLGYMLFTSSGPADSFPPGLYAVTNRRVIRVLTNTIEDIALRSDIERIQSLRHHITLTMTNTRKLRLKVVEGLRLPGPSAL